MPVRCSVLALAFATATVAVLASGCASTQGGNDGNVSVVNQVAGRPDATAVAQIEGTPGNFLGGKVSFAQFGSVVVVRASFQGLPSNTTFGLHVHERANCSSTDGSAAGGHFNPGGAPHGRPGSGAHHAGDLPNVQSLGEGAVFYAFETRALSVSDGPTSVIGRSVILSRLPDDYQTQPDGKSGPPLACGIIRLT